MADSYVYFVEAKNLGLVKIGFSKDPSKRLKDLQTGSPDELEGLFTFPGTKQKEKELHRKLHRFRVRGEWFKLDDIGSIYNTLYEEMLRERGGPEWAKYQRDKLNSENRAMLEYIAREGWRCPLE